MNPESSKDNSGINEAGKDNTAQTIIEGDVDVQSGDFVTRDQHIHGDVIYGDKVAGNKVTIGTLIANFFRGDSDDVHKLRNRQVMIQLVRDIWVKGVLEHSLYNQLLIDLEMEHRPEGVERPWGMVLDMPEQTSRPLPSGTKMIDVFHELNQSLLILGEPGSGKSTMLLELARDLLIQAEHNPTLPIPVYFNLSTWAEKRQPIRLWLVEELREKYHIPKNQAQVWVENDELLLLLDGLDEVKQGYREACVTALNDYQQSCKSVVSLALCSRTAEYSVLTRKLKLNGAIVLRSLTEQQIDTFLMRAGDRLAGVAQLLQQDRELQALAQSPLTLSILCLTYQDRILSEIQLEEGAGTRLKQLFDAYILQMFRRPGKLLNDKYPGEKTLHWLAWLAARMVQHEKNEFLLEDLQPSWLSMHKSISIYALCVPTLCALLIGIAFNLNGNFFKKSYTELTDEIILYLLGGTSVGLVNFVRLRETPSKFIIKDYRKSMLAIVSIGTIFGTLGGLYVGIRTVIERNHLIWIIPSLAITGPFLGVFGILTFGAFSLAIFYQKSNKDDVVFTEKFKLSKLGLYRGLFFGLLCSLPIIAFFVLLLLLVTAPSDLDSQVQTRVLIFLLLTMFIFIGGLLGLAKFDIQISESNITSNTKLKASLKSSLLLGISSGLLLEILVPLLAGLYTRLDAYVFGWKFVTYIPPLDYEEMINYTVEHMSLHGVGGVIGTLTFLWFGGIAVLQHFMLRFLLLSFNQIPANYTRFLDYCADRIFLRKIGGGYIFVHRLLMEHFAALPEADIQRLAGTTKNR